jgi:hypothetical protein
LISDGSGVRRESGTFRVKEEHLEMMALELKKIHAT